MKRFISLVLVLTVLAFARVALAGAGEEIKSEFDRFVAAQNAHDATAVKDLLQDSSDFLWITRGTSIWGREAAMKRFEVLYQGTWKLDPRFGELRVVELSPTTALVSVPIVFTLGAPGQPAQPQPPTLWNGIYVKTAAGWKVASILPINTQ